MNLLCELAATLPVAVAVAAGPLIKSAIDCGRVRRDRSIESQEAGQLQLHRAIAAGERPSERARGGVRTNAAEKTSRFQCQVELISAVALGEFAR